MSKDISHFSCIDCSTGNCDHMSKQYPEFCPTTHMNPILLEDALNCYNIPENNQIMRIAAEVEYEYYCKMTRVEETVAFCKKMGYEKVGIATCVGLLHEAGIFAKILRKNNLEVVGIGCKSGAIPKHKVGISKEYEKIGCNICNPILQAKYLNSKKTQFNVLIGLCVGHDSLFYRYSDAPVSTLITKDRILAHNPVGALYQSKAYYSKLLDD